MSKKDSTEVTKPEERAVAAPVKLRPARIEGELDEMGAIEGLPDEFLNTETYSGFPPSPKWDNPGDAVFGYYLSQQTNIGPNASKMYEISVPRKGEEPKTVAVWGTAALDRLMAQSTVQIGDKVAIIYLGTKPSKPGFEPTKLFALKVAKVAK